ncbi:scabin-related ADP-ribosyltransferase, partial [Saccharopolyspora thermophila]|uniref:scabin-related ADP-ribosyltransferase n=1 Tax=Saccharopolyspora thermophila TaxID=89367 RepID=UPI003D154223
SFVREFVRDLVADCISRLITYALEALAPPGVSLAWVVPQAVGFIGRTVARIAKIVTKLIRTISNVAPKLAKLVEVFGDIMKALGKLGKQAADGVRAAAGRIGRVADRLDVAGKLSDKVAEKAWKKVDDTFGTDVVGRHNATFDAPGEGSDGSGSSNGSGSSGSSGASGSGSGSPGDGSGPGGNGSESSGGPPGPAGASPGDGSARPTGSGTGGGSPEASARTGAPASSSAVDSPTATAESPRAAAVSDGGAAAHSGSGPSSAPQTGGSGIGPSGGGVDSSGGPHPGGSGSSPHEVPTHPAGTSSASVEAPTRPDAPTAPPSIAPPRADQPVAGSGAMGGGPVGGPTTGAAPSVPHTGRPGAGGWTGTPGNPGAAGRPVGPHPGGQRPTAPRPVAPVQARSADAQRWDGLRRDDFATAEPQGSPSWGPGSAPERPVDPEPAPDGWSTTESMAAERPPEGDPSQHRWDVRAGVRDSSPLNISDELKAKLGTDGLQRILHSRAGLSMVHGRPDMHDVAGRRRLPDPMPDPRRFTVEVHGSPNGVSVRGVELSAKELAEIIKGSPAYEPGTPVRLLSCRTGADLPDGSPSFAEQLSKELGVEVLAPKTDAWVDNHGNIYASGSQARFEPDASGTPQPHLDDPGEWVAFRPDGTTAVHESPYPPGHEPEWIRHGVQADAAERRGIPREFLHPGGPAFSGMHHRLDDYGTPIPGHLSPTGEFVPHGHLDAYGTWVPHGHVDDLGRWVPGRLDADGRLVPCGHYDAHGQWIAHGRTDELGRWIPVHRDASGYHDLGRFNPRTHQWEPLGHVDPNTGRFHPGQTPPAAAPHHVPRAGHGPNPATTPAHAGQPPYPPRRPQPPVMPQRPHAGPLAPPRPPQQPAGPPHAPRPGEGFGPRGSGGRTDGGSGPAGGSARSDFDPMGVGDGRAKGGYVPADPNATPEARQRLREKYISQFGEDPDILDWIDEEVDKELGPRKPQPPLLNFEVDKSVQPVAAPDSRNPFGSVADSSGMDQAAVEHALSHGRHDVHLHWRDDLGELYRHDNRHPNEIWGGKVGFEPKTDELSLRNHFDGNNGQGGGLVSTTRDHDYARDRAIAGARGAGQRFAFVYRIDAAGGLDMNMSSSNLGHDVDESEVAFVGGIDFRYIPSCDVYDVQTGELLGTYHNPYYYKNLQG